MFFWTGDQLSDFGQITGADPGYFYERRTHPLRGALFENFILLELLKQRFNKGLRNNFYFSRDRTGNEIDILLDTAKGAIPIEIKANSTYNNSPGGRTQRPRACGACVFSLVHFGEQVHPAPKRKTSSQELLRGRCVPNRKFLEPASRRTGFWHTKGKVSLLFPASGLNTLENFFAGNFGKENEKPEKI